jgi:hypothetical protein
MPTIVGAIRELLDRPDVWPETKDELRGYLTAADTERLQPEDRGFIAALYARLTGAAISEQEAKDPTNPMVPLEPQDTSSKTPGGDVFSSGGEPLKMLETSVSPELAPQIPARSVAPKSTEEILVERIEHFRSAMREVSVRLANEIQETLQNADDKIKRAKKFVHETGIDGALCRLLEQFGISLSEIFAEVDLTNVRSEGQYYKEGTYLISFEFVEHIYFLRLVTHRGSEDPTRYGSLTLVEDSVEVFAIEVTERVDRAFDHLGWNPSKVTLLTVGGWVSRLVEIDERLTLAKEKHRRLHLAEATLKDAEGLFVDKGPEVAKMSISTPPGATLAKILEEMPAQDRLPFLAHVEQSAQQSGDLDTLREIQAYKKDREGY